ncbi:hypothetical protein LSAT2_012378 [Lamellibrachia satsuma]|nr:hypothetical protein LSAT2_012378 [Lamellibrachia satsuma]
MEKVIVFSIIVLLQVMAVRSEMLTYDVARSSISAVSLKQCSKRDLDYQGVKGLAFSCVLVKKRDDTVLRVVWNGLLRLSNTGPKLASVRRWFFTFNGQECKEPNTIDTQIFADSNNIDIHRQAYVEGYCRGIPAGYVNVGWNVGDILSWRQAQYNVGNPWTGWVATVRIIVEEIGVEDADTSCDFVKKLDDTVLRLINSGTKHASARRWFFTINGEECKEPNTIDTQLHTGDRKSNVHRPAYVEGYCRDIPAGDVKFGWNVGDIVHGKSWSQNNYNVGDSWTGWMATVRIIVEEVDVGEADTVVV